jgi:hypothetical protein
VITVGGQLEFNFWQGFFLFAARLARGFTQLPIKMGTRGSFLGVKWLGHEADNSPTSSAEVKNTWICLHSPIQVKFSLTTYDAWNICPLLN